MTTNLFRDPKEVLAPWTPADKGKKRLLQAGDMMLRELAVLLLQKTGDPRLRHVRLQRLELTADMKSARIFFTVEGENSGDSLPPVKEALKRARGFFRSHLARTINLRYTPELIFIHDTAAVQVERLGKILANIKSHED